MINNKLLNTIGKMDDRHIRENELAELDDSLSGKKKKPKKLRFVIIAAAAAAAALALMIGAASVDSDHSTFSIGKDVAFNIHLRKHNITIPEEYMPTEESKYIYNGKVDMSNTELFEKFNAPMLITDKFSAEPDPDAEGIISWTYENLNTGEKYEVNSEPFIEVMNTDVCFSYYIYSKTLNRNINFYAYYLTDMASGSEGIQDGINSDIPVEIIKLRDGSKCAVTPGYACFSYNGVYYRFGLGKGEFTQEMTMQVLEDLDVI